MAFTIGKEYICQGQDFFSEPIRMRILQAVPAPNLYKITSTNLFNSDFVQAHTPFMIFTNSRRWDGRVGENDILGRFIRGEESLTNIFNREDCLRFCEYIGTRSNWQEVEESAESLLKRSRAKTPPQTPKLRY